MLQLPKTVILRDLINSADCEAEIVHVSRDLAKRKIDGEWWKLAISRTKRREEGDHGSGLLLYAVCHSYALGLGGRLVLVSLATEKTRQFYANRGFTTVGEDENGDREYELEPGIATCWLQEKGFLE
jgi:hypothetical protein